MDEDDDRASALATAIMSAATYRELRDAATETAELLVDPPEPLPAFDAGIRAIYRRLYGRASVQRMPAVEIAGAAGGLNLLFRVAGIFSLRLYEASSIKMTMPP